MPTYLTRALVKVDANNPLEAVAEYKDQLNRVPLDEWIYRVEDDETGEMFYVHRDEVMTLEQMAERFDIAMAEQGSTEDEEDGEDEEIESRLEAAEEGGRSERGDGD